MQPSGSAALEIWLGRTIAATGSVPHVLGFATFASPGAATGPYGWLYDVVLYVASSTGGREALVVVESLWFCAAMLVLAARCKARGLGAPLTVSVLVIATIATLGATFLSPSNLNWFFLGAVLLALESQDSRWSFVVVPLSVLWCNFDPAGLLAAVAALLYAFGTFVEREPSSAARRTIVVAALSVLATFATPWGLELPRHALAATGLDPSLRALSLWQAPGVYGPAYTLAFIALAIVACVSGLWTRSRPSEVFVTLGAALLALCNGMYLPAFAFAAAPVVARAVKMAGAHIIWHVWRSVVRDIALVAAAVGACAVLWVADDRGAANRPSAMLVSRIAGDGRDHRIVCVEIAACAAFVASDIPSLRVLMDGRPAAYPERVRIDQTIIAALHPTWRTRLTKWRIDTIVASRQSTVAAVLALLPDRWHVAASDGAFDVYELESQ